VALSKKRPKQVVVIMPLHVFLMCLDFEYPMQFCSSILRKDIFELEKVQGKVTRMIKGVEWLPNQESLNRVGWKLNDKVRVRQSAINHTCVSQGKQAGHNGSTVPFRQKPGGWREARRWLAENKGKATASHTTCY